MHFPSTLITIVSAALALVSILPQTSAKGTTCGTCDTNGIACADMTVARHWTSTRQSDLQGGKGQELYWSYQSLAKTGVTGGRLSVVRTFYESSDTTDITVTKIGGPSKYLLTLSLQGPGNSGGGPAAPLSTTTVKYLIQGNCDINLSNQKVIKADLYVQSTDMGDHL